ncbi:hypothetical protein GQR58_019540 [Nymphon striatum]|nr:hypothetical protein GQR58_019540 [Nymphon striatum]
MSVCKFWKKGNCNYGDRCWYAHEDPSPGNHQYFYIVADDSQNFNERYDSEQDFTTSRYTKNSNQNRYATDNYENYEYDTQQEYTPPRYSNKSNKSFQSHQNRYATDKQYDTQQEFAPPRKSNQSFQSHQNRYATDSHKQYDTQQEFAPPRYSNKSNQSFQSHNNKYVTGSHGGNDHRSKHFSGTDSTNLRTEVLYELEFLESGQQWPFTCVRIRYLESTVAIPGFNDLSMEELRWNAYVAKQNNIESSYKVEAAELMNEVIRKRDVLRNMSEFEFEEMIKTGISPFQPTSSNLFQSGVSESKEDQIKKAATSFSFNLSDTAFDDNSGRPLSSEPSNAFNKTAINSQSAFSAPSFGGGNFGNFTSASNPSSVFHQSQHQDKESENSDSKCLPYSQLSELTDADKEQFSSNTFVIGKIPTLPPTLHMCKC